jgi:16S rRNA (guanine966-N2)-methyltransferase
VFVEHERSALACIRENIDAVGAKERVEVLGLRVASVEKALGAARFDLVLCDPPWDELEMALSALARLTSSERLAPGARVVLEHSARDTEPEVPGLVAFDRRSWGDTAVSFFSSASSDADGGAPQPG